MVKIINKICIAGDSHTWGQGAADRVFQDFEIPVVAGEKRLLPFCVPSFPTLLRKYINVKSGSEAMEFSGKDISERFDREYTMECARVRGELCINKEFDFARIELKRGSSDTDFICDGMPVQSFKAYEIDDEYIVKNITPDSRADKLIIKSDDAFLYRIELYKGKYAVVNCGISSCSSFKYTKDYLDKYVLSINPTIVIAEIFTVNDWLSAKAPEECENSLVKFGKRIIESRAKLVFSSVIPILGRQKNGLKADYLEYVQAGERAARTLRIPYADTYAAFSKEYTDSPQPTHYGDEWHPGVRGHEIYFEELKKSDTICELCREM